MTKAKEFIYHNKHIGSQVGIALISETDNSANANRDLAKAVQLIEGYEARFSRFIDNSELSLLNKNAGNRIQVSPLFMEILLLARQLHKESHRVFNPLLQVSSLGAMISHMKKYLERQM